MRRHFPAVRFSNNVGWNCLELSIGLQESFHAPHEIVSYRSVIMWKSNIAVNETEPSVNRAVDEQNIVVVNPSMISSLEIDIKRADFTKISEARTRSSRSSLEPNQKWLTVDIEIIWFRWRIRVVQPPEHVSSRSNFHISPILISRSEARLSFCSI